MIHRRHFLKTSAVVSLTPTIPAFLTRSLDGAEAGKDRRILVVIQLDGGNDGINTVVPFKDEGYAESRKEIRLKAADLIRLNDEVGLHPRLRGMSELLEDGRLGIVQGVGYPNPDRSHFRSMAIWHAADTDVETHHGSGWIGQSLSSSRREFGPDSIFVGESELPVALRGRRSVAATISSVEDLSLKLSGLTTNHQSGGEDLISFLQRNVSDAYATAESLSKSNNALNSEDAQYPFGELGNRLKLISKMIKSDAAARVYYTSQDGYDTHASQLNAHANLLGTFSGALKAFMDDMQESGLGDQVLVMAFSEFGRRVRENGSAGTDHGTAGPVFVAGSKVKVGLHGTTPSLTDLDAGDLKHSTDFRNVYVALIDKWLELRRPAFLNEFQPLPLLL